MWTFRKLTALSVAAVFMVSSMGLPAWARQAAPEAGVATVATALSCAEAREIVITATGETPPAEVDIATMKLRQCLAEEYNAKNPDDPIVTLAAYEPETGTVLFNTIKLKDAQAVHQGCMIATSVVSGQMVTEDPVTGVIAGGLGRYGCGAYLQAAIADNPLLILMPTYVPAYQLTVDTWRELKRVTARLADGPGGVIPGTNIPLIMVAPQVALVVAAGEPAENVRREVDRFFQNTSDEAERFRNRLPRITIPTPRPPRIPSIPSPKPCSWIRAC